MTDADSNETVEWYRGDDVISFGPSLLRNHEGVYTLEIRKDPNKPSVFHWILMINKMNASRDVDTWSCKLEGPPSQEVSTELIKGGESSARVESLGALVYT